MCRQSSRVREVDRSCRKVGVRVHLFMLRLSRVLDRGRVSVRVLSDSLLKVMSHICKCFKRLLCDRLDFRPESIVALKLGSWDRGLRVIEDTFRRFLKRPGKIAFLARVSSRCLSNSRISVG